MSDYLSQFIPKELKSSFEESHSNEVLSAIKYLQEINFSESEINFILLIKLLVDLPWLVPLRKSISFAPQILEAVTNGINLTIDELQPNFDGQKFRIKLLSTITYFKQIIELDRGELFEDDNGKSENLTEGELYEIEQLLYLLRRAVKNL